MIGYIYIYGDELVGGMCWLGDIIDSSAIVVGKNLWQVIDKLLIYCSWCMVLYCIIYK
jgi:hypothetical protein